MELAIEQASELRGWWEETKDLGTSLHSQSIDLAYELLDRHRERLVQLLQQISSGIELLLEDHDDHDEISLGFVEVLVHESAERGLNRSEIRNALGPLAQQTWDDLDRHRASSGSGGPAV